LGNLLNRTLNMAQQYRQGSLKRPSDPSTLILTNTPVEFESAAKFFEAVMFGYSGSFEIFDIDASLDDVIMCAVSCNGFIETAKPWLLAKNGTKAGRLDEILYALCESLRIIAILISPVLPKAAHGIFDQLNWKMELSGTEARFSLADTEWGKLPDGHVVGKPVPLFPRIETN
jgi:methionyl-tRNA synthetase